MLVVVIGAVPALASVDAKSVRVIELSKASGVPLAALDGAPGAVTGPGGA